MRLPGLTMSSFPCARVEKIARSRSPLKSSMKWRQSLRACPVTIGNVEDVEDVEDVDEIVVDMLHIVCGESRSSRSFRSKVPRLLWSTTVALVFPGNS